tara:strand:+ start:58 stop:288 length:231 start_codon:yes stop_codon:yes gene_type:complete
MNYSFTLEKEQAKALIELIEKNRCEGENQLCVELRKSIKSQYYQQYKENQKDETMSEEDIVENAKSYLGNFCDHCE